MSAARALLGPLKGVARALPSQTLTTASLSSTARTADFDVAIIGGGVIGSSVALHLSALAPQKKVVVLERDSTYAKASAPRSAGGIRQQFSLPVNVQLSIYGVEFLRRILAELCAAVDVDTDVQFRENGYLLLAADSSGAQALRENHEVQREAGADWIELLEPGALRTRFPWLSTEGVTLGAFGTRNEGYFDPWALLQAMRKGATARGVLYREAEVVSTAVESNQLRSVTLADGSVVSASTFVNAAGAFGGRITSLCGPDVTPLPVVPKRRCIWQVHAPLEVASDTVTPRAPSNTPLTIDSSGVYFRSEGGPGRFLCGVSPDPEDDPDCEHWDDVEPVTHELFEEVVWPAMASRAPAFEALKVESSWAGFYEYNTLDQNGVVGYHPDVTNMLVACGFSGHGLQQAPGVGRAVAELLAHGGYATLDLSCLGWDRIVKNEPLFERGIY